MAARHKIETDPPGTNNMDSCNYSRYAVYFGELISASVGQTFGVIAGVGHLPSLPDDALKPMVEIRGVTADRELVWCCGDNIYYVSLDNMKSGLLDIIGDGAAEWLSDEDVAELFINRQVEVRRPDGGFSIIWIYFRYPIQPDNIEAIRAVVSMGRGREAESKRGAISAKVVKHFRV